MFRRQTETLHDVLLKVLHKQGLETPILQKRLVEAWPTVAGPVIARYTTETYIYNPDSYTHLTLPTNYPV